MQLDSSNVSSPDDKYWSELLMLFSSVLSIIIGFYYI
jgi:hypothetical protein